MDQEMVIQLVSGGGTLMFAVAVWMELRELRGVLTKLLLREADRIHEERS
jgi:glycerate-2-kinase